MLRVGVNLLTRRRGKTNRTSVHTGWSNKRVAAQQTHTRTTAKQAKVTTTTAWQRGSYNLSQSRKPVAMTARVSSMRVGMSLPCTHHTHKTGWNSCQHKRARAHTHTRRGHLRSDDGVHDDPRITIAQCRDATRRQHDARTADGDGQDGRARVS